MVAAAVMIGGIALLGVVSGLAMSWFVRMIDGAGQRYVSGLQVPVAKRSLTNGRRCGRTVVCVTHLRAWRMCRGGS